MCVPASALAKSVTVSSGGVTAKLDYTPGKFSMDSDVAIRISQGSNLLYSGAAAGQCGKSCQVVPDPVMRASPIGMVSTMVLSEVRTM